MFARSTFGHEEAIFLILSRFFYDFWIDPCIDDCCVDEKEVGECVGSFIAPCGDYFTSLLFG